jgi:hypothetical protein
VITKSVRIKFMLNGEGPQMRRQRATKAKRDSAKAKRRRFMQKTSRRRNRA